MDQTDLLKRSWPQIADLVCRATVCLLTPSKQIPYDYNGSGTLINVENRLFVATAAHLIPPDPNHGNLWIMSEKRRHPLDEGVLEFIRHKKAPGFDVGYLELEPKTAADYLECEPCPIERVRVLGPGRAKRHVALVGAPQELVKLEGEKGARGIIPVVKPFLTIPLMPDEWPDVPQHAPSLNPDNDVVLELPQQGVIDFETDAPIVYQTAQGYSGGGVWDLGFEPGILWQPSEVALFGIQSRWQEEKRYLRAVQILHWLRLLYKEYADLRSTLAALFPDLSRV